jgi:hypothetical protein
MNRVLGEFSSRRNDPPCVVAICEEILKPSPTPEPGGLVVKNGSIIFDRISCGMLNPESETTK